MVGPGGLRREATNKERYKGKRQKEKQRNYRTLVEKSKGGKEHNEGSENLSERWNSYPPWHSGSPAPGR